MNKIKVVPERTVAEIQEQLNQTITCQTANEVKLENLREERAHLVVEGDAKNEPRIDSLDKQIATLRDTLSNTPAVILELEKILTARQLRDAENKRDELIKQQLEVAEDVQVLSKNFVSLLSKAAEVNSHLQTARSAEAALAEKTGQQVLQSYCQGSQDYLRVLLETMQLQTSGVHTQPCGAGIISSGVELRI